ncbi:uncharacterized protein LOC134709994 isoform X1 [Mytilus trossulus]|uniref:uncharacterized protein LOC134709994 isoform X1 n=1 Tax=Mytilus trossulus TaxID=6551 RepID=UPI0030074D9E
MCTLRLQITLNNRFKNASTILNKAVINLEHESCALSKEEKQNILMKHLIKRNLENKTKQEEIDEMCKTIYAFPLLCKLVSNNEVRFRKKIEFFRKPLSLLKDELDQMIHENKNLYCMLVLCMLFNGTFSRNMFKMDSNDCDKKIYKIMYTCGLQRSISKKELEDSALFALGSYFTTDSFNFQFIHDALEETVGIHFCTLYPKEMFTECDILFIRDRVRIHSNESITENVDENIVYIREDELNDAHRIPLYTRFRTELKYGRFSSLVMSHLFKNRNFVCIFGTFLKSNKSKKGSLDYHKYFSMERFQSTVQKILQIFPNHQFQINKDAISRVMQAGLENSTIIHWIVAFGRYEFFQYAWSAMTPSRQQSFFSKIHLPRILAKPFFPLAVLGGSLDIVKELIRTGADVNCFSEFWETPLYIAVKLDNYEMAHLLLCNGALVNHRGWFDMKIPILITSNNQQLTSLILEYDLNQTEFHKAVRHNDLQKLGSNIPFEYIDYQTRSGWTILHYAVLLNNVEAVKVILKDELPQNDCYSVEFTQDDQREVLCRKPTPRVDVYDNNGLTAVHIAVINNNIEILSLLLRNKADVKVRDDFDRTPLHYATSERATTLLLSHSSKNQCLVTNQNANEMREYENSPRSVFSTICYNFTLKTAFRNVCRDFVNLPDSAGNTPLHSVLNNGLFEEERSNCIKTLLHNGANPYLFNDMSISASELIDSSCDTDINISNSAECKKSLEKIRAVFSFASSVFAIGFIIGFSLIYDRNVGKNVSDCFTESYKITLEQVIRIPYVIILAIAPFWSLILVRFNMRGSVFFCSFCINRIWVVHINWCMCVPCIHTFKSQHFVFHAMFCFDILRATRNHLPFDVCYIYVVER